MTQGTPEQHEQFKEQLSNTDFEQIKTNLKLKIYGDGWKKKMAELFVETEERNSDEQHREKQIEISREAVRTAKEANNISKIACWVSVFSAVIAIVAIVISFFHT